MNLSEELRKYANILNEERTDEYFDYGDDADTSNEPAGMPFYKLPAKSSAVKITNKAHQAGLNTVEFQGQYLSVSPNQADRLEELMRAMRMQFTPVTGVPDWGADDSHLSRKERDRGMPYKFSENKSVIRKRFPKLEKAIIQDQDPELASLYAIKVIGGRWPEAEPVIAKDSESASLYARYILKGPWPEAGIK